ncbi:MAG TPA: glycosyltransferase family A protein, partial [Solirubrobacteraceae bacterium]
MAVSARPIALSQTSIECLDDQTPVAVRAIDLEQCPSELQLALSGRGHAYRQLLVLVRQDGYPVGWRSFAVGADGAVSLEGLAGGPIEVGPPDSARTPEPETLPLVSVVIATCANSETAVSCVEAIQSAASGPYEVIVVENRPARSTVKHALDERFDGDERVRYVEERRPGLACARNAGLRAARGELVAFTDDDVTVDPAWLPAIRASFEADPEVDCMTGLILPLELETPAQLLLERFAGYAKGFLPRVYALDN